MKRNKMIMAYWLIMAVAFLRLLPHPPGFTPIGALGLFSGTYMERRWAWLTPILALVIGDAVIGFYDPLIMAAVYIGFVCTACIGRLLLRKKHSGWRMASAIVFAALVFFVITNASWWWVFYPHTLAGLVVCYLNGLPFLGVALIADTFYAALMFGVYEYWRHRPHACRRISVISR